MIQHFAQIYIFDGDSVTWGAGGILGVNLWGLKNVIGLVQNVMEVYTYKYSYLYSFDTVTSADILEGPSAKSAKCTLCLEVYIQGEHKYNALLI